MLNHSPITIQSQPAHNTKPFFSFLFKNTLPLLDYFKIKNRHFFKSKVFPETKQVGNPCRKSITFEKKFKKITAKKITFFFSKQVEIFQKVKDRILLLNGGFLNFYMGIKVQIRSKQIFFNSARRDLSIIIYSTFSMNVFYPHFFQIFFLFNNL